MQLGDKKSAKVEGGLTLTGTVVYIHPARIFYVLEFEFAHGKYRESFLTGVEQYEDRRKSAGGKPIRFTSEQDNQILKTKNVKKTAKQLGISEASVYQRRRRLRKRGAVA